MPTDTLAATAAGRSFTDGDGKEWFISPLVEKQWAEYLGWIQDQYVAVVKRNVQGLSDEVVLTLMREAFAVAHALDFKHPDAKAIYAQPHGVARLIFLGLQRRHPEITEEKVMDLLLDESVRMNATQAFNIANPAGDVSPKAQSGESAAVPDETRAPPKIAAHSTGPSPASTDGPQTRSQT